MEVNIPISEALELSDFKAMDYYAVEHYQLPIELMMENAGLQLAKLAVDSAKDHLTRILIGIGNGNNGGGGLVAARRLAAWGYEVYLDLMSDIEKELPKKQLERALAFGVSKEVIDQPDIWIDAYLGFSQRLPLTQDLKRKINKANQLDCIRISLDIPTGFLGDTSTPHFQAHQVLSLAASKKILYNMPQETEIFLADLGIPKTVYEKFNISIPPFDKSNILKIIR